MSTETEDGAAEMTAALSGFLKEFKSFRDDIHTKLERQDEQMSKLDRKTMQLGRPALAGGAEGEAPHKMAFAAYLRSGDDDPLRAVELEGKAMSSAVAADGGYLVDPQTAETVRSTLSATASIRAIANDVTVDATSYDVLIDHTEMGAGWATENGGLAETDTHDGEATYEMALASAGEVTFSAAI